MSKKHKQINVIVCVVSMIFTGAASADTQGPLQVFEPQLEQQMQDVFNILEQKIYPAVTDSASATQQANSTLRRGLTGSTGIATTNNLAAEQKFRNWTPTAQDLEKMVKQGLQTGSLADRIKYYNQKFPIPSVEQLTPGNQNSANGNYGVFSAVETNAALSVADKGFNNAVEITQQINSLYQKIDDQDTVKKGIDMNSVILLKIAALQADLMRIQAQQLKMQAVSQQAGNTQRSVMSEFIQNVQ